MKTFADAVILACQAHEDQVDKGGNPYILHPLRIAQQMQTSEERIVAMLHDVIEDTDIPLQYLRDEGYSDTIVEAIDALTRRDGETYMDYIRRAKQNPIARKVKIADIKDNMDLSRIPEPTEKDLQRMKRYEKALKVLEEE
jgi:(p)ppGpp synthase/HD superfamily hydrolase